MTAYTSGKIQTRWATLDDLLSLKTLINRSIDALQVEGSKNPLVLKPAL
ncbi:hypothetical protein [Gluconobacter oxydans]|nr:hypothetical protein [Gluconobacter oxydans]WKE49695.1 hypothetical protein NUJ38_14290 [Gluconobacter oxydans]